MPASYLGCRRALFGLRGILELLSDERNRSHDPCSAV